MQRVTKYPLLLSRLLKVTPSHHPDRAALQEARERVEHHLEHMNQVRRETFRVFFFTYAISCITMS